MRLVFASEYVNEDTPAIAFVERTRSLARALAGMGLEVTMVTPEILAPGTTEASYSIVSLAGIRSRGWLQGNIIGRAVPPTLFAWRFAALLRRRRPECVLVSFHNPLYSFMTTLAGKLNGGITVFDVHDSWVYMSAHHQGRLRNMIRMSLERLSMHLATGTTTVSLPLRDMIARQYRLPPGSIHVVQNGADIPAMVPPASKDIDIIHVGSPRATYDTLSFIEALSLMSRFGVTPSVLFLGCREDQYVEKVKAKTSELGLSGQIRFEPQVPHKEVGGWLARSKVAALTVPMDFWGTASNAVKFFEYAAYGLPLAHLGPENGEIAKMLKVGGFGVMSSTVQGFAEAVAGLLKDEDERKLMGKKAREFAERHTWAASASELAEVLGGPRQR